MRAALSIITLILITTASTGCLSVSIHAHKKSNDGTVVVYEAHGVVSSIEQKDIDLIRSILEEGDQQATNQVESAKD